MIRPWLDVSVVSRRPLMSVRTEFLRLATWGSCSSDGRADATGIINPTLGETTASAARRAGTALIARKGAEPTASGGSGKRIARSRSFLTFVLRLGGREPASTA